MPELVPQTQNGSLTDHQLGTDDTFVGFTFLYGDALAMYDDSQGGNDSVKGADYSPENELFGDATLMEDNSHGGNDTLIGGDYSTANLLYGDAGSMSGNTIGGNDTLIGGHFSLISLLYGDAAEMSGSDRWQRHPDRARRCLQRALWRRERDGRR
jgi:hypothetical protein